MFGLIRGLKILANNMGRFVVVDVFGLGTKGVQVSRTETGNFWPNNRLPETGGNFTPKFHPFYPPLLRILQ
jgi:hypothetical protein